MWIEIILLNIIGEKYCLLRHHPSMERRWSVYGGSFWHHHCRVVWSIDKIVFLWDGKQDNFCRSPMRWAETTQPSHLRYKRSGETAARKRKDMEKKRKNKTGKDKGKKEIRSNRTHGAWMVRIQLYRQCCRCAWQNYRGNSVSRSNSEFLTTMWLWSASQIGVFVSRTLAFWVPWLHLVKSNSGGKWSSGWWCPWKTAPANYPMRT